MKKLTSIVLALALALTVVAPVAASAQSAGHTFSTNLTVGSRGSDVVALQSFLVAKGFLTMPAGVAMGYFGGLTKSALAAYQSSKGITPAAGYFGPITRAAVMAEGGVATTPGCSAGAMYNSVTGQPCGTTTPVTPGCPAGALYNSMTGAACSTSAPWTPSGVEGSLDIRLAATPASNADIQTSTDVPVLGIEFRGKIGDSVVQTIDLKTSVTNVTDSSVDNPGSFINTIKVWDGSTLLATVPVGLNTFTKDTSNVYYVRIPGLNFLVPKDATKVLTFTFSTSGSIDSNRSVVVGLYNTTSVRSVSGNGVNSFGGDTSISLTHTFKKPGSATLTLSAASSPLRSTNNKIQTSSGAKGVSTLLFNVKAETGDAKITTIYASTTSTNSKPTTLYLYDGSTLLASKPVDTTTGSVTFDNLTYVVAKDTTKTLTVKADWASDATSGSVSTTTINYVRFDKPTGSTATSTGAAVAGVGHYVFTSAAQYALAGTPTISAGSPNTNGSTTALTATFTFNVTAMGAAVTQATSSNFTIGFGTTTAYSIAAGSVSVVTIPNNNISDGSTAVVTVTAQLPASSITHSGLYNAAITTIRWTAGSNTQDQTWGLDDFKTTSAANFIK